MSATALFLEFPGDADRFGELLTQPETTVIALMPQIAHELRQRGIAFRYPEDFFDWRKMEEDAIALLDELKDLCAVCDDALQDRWPDAKQHAFAPFRSAFYELHLFRGAIWTKVYRIRAVMDALAPASVVYADLPRGEGRSDPLSFADWSLYAEAVRLVCRERGVACRDVIAPARVLEDWKHPPMAGPPERTMSLPERVLAKLRRSLPSFERPRAEPRVLMVHALTALPALRRIANVQLWEDVRAQFAGVGMPRNEAVVPGDVLDAWWTLLRDDPRVRRCFRIGDVDWFPIAEEGLHHVATRLTQRAWAVRGEAERAFDAVRPDAVVFGHISTIEGHTVARVARRRGLPVITEPHGPYGHYINYVCTLFDAIASTHYLVPGEGSVDYDAVHGGFPIEHVVTGSALIDASRRDRVPRREGLDAIGLDPARPTVMLVIQVILWNWEYGPYSVRDDRRSFEIQTEVLRTLAEFPDIQVILKGHPALFRPISPTVEIGKAMMGPRLAYVANWPFRRMLDMADCFVLDYAVTTPYEALTTDKKIYALHDFYKLFSPAEEPLHAAADFFADVPSLLTALRTDLASGVALRPDARRSGEFMRRYGDPFRDGRATERVAKAIVDIARASRR